MIDYEDYELVKSAVMSDYAAEKECRDFAKQATAFITAPNGQWEDNWWNNNQDKPRYTFDMTTQIVDQISGEIAAASFDSKVSPAGNGADKETAGIFDGLIRNIENLSDASDVYSEAGRKMIVSGIGGWQVSQAYTHDSSFEQDLVVEPITDFVDRVWFDRSSIKPDRSDAMHCMALGKISASEFSERWPKRPKESFIMPENWRRSRGSDYLIGADTSITIADFYYIDEVSVDLVLMSNDKVYDDDDDFKAVSDELLAAGVTEKDRRRRRKKKKVMVRKMDGKGWLGEAVETVFSFIPIIPVYGDFEIIDGVIFFRGAVLSLMDPQRTLNYSLSREVEEGALSPRAKYWMTPKQAAGHELKLSTLNTNADPVQLYNPDPAAIGPPPQSGGAQINPGLRVISETMIGLMGQVANVFAAYMGSSQGDQSGVAIKELRNNNGIGKTKYFRAIERAIRHTNHILITSIPKVYSKGRQAQILSQDGSTEVITLGEEVFDDESQTIVTLNDLSKGYYSVECSAGKSFASRREETSTAIMELASIDPTIIQEGGDVLLNSIDAPGFDMLAERRRARLILSGLIPATQMTEEEKATAAQQDQGQAPDAATILANAEQLKAEAQMSKVAADKQLRETDQMIEVEKLKQKDGENEAIDKHKQQKFMLELEAMRQSLDLKREQDMRNHHESMVMMQKQQAETLKILRDAMGASAIVSQNAAAAYEEQAQEVREGPPGQEFDTTAT